MHLYHTERGCNLSAKCVKGRFNSYRISNACRNARSLKSDCLRFTSKHEHSYNKHVDGHCVSYGLVGAAGLEPAAKPL